MASESGEPQSQLRRDAVTNRWVLFSPARAKRPSDFKSNTPSSLNPNHNCPFCLGNEHQCAPEIFRVPPHSPHWSLRVIHNLYPALPRLTDHDLNLDLDVTSLAAPAAGFHDVVIESPTHSVQLSDLSAPDIAHVLLAYRDRILQILSDYHSICYVQVFKNHGASAGASMSHSHSQMVALPIIPPAVSSRLHTMKQYYERTQKCSVCEIRVDDLLIESSTHFVSVTPFAATFPFEIWIIPRDHSPHFHEIDDDKAVDLGGILKLMLRKLSLQLNNPPFNFMIQSSPLKAADSEVCYCHWYLQIVPQLSGVGGFEIGSGCYINAVFPEEAAKILREVHVT